MPRDRCQRRCGQLRRPARLARGRRGHRARLLEDEQYLRRLGVAEVVPRDGDVGAAVRAIHSDGVDAVIDLISYTAEVFAA